MALIKTIDPEHATSELADFYREVVDKSGAVANILKVQSLSPPTQRAHYTLYRALMFGANPLSRAQRELIAVAVSQANQCHY